MAKLVPAFFIDMKNSNLEPKYHYKLPFILLVFLFTIIVNNHFSNDEFGGIRWELNPTSLF